ncbi:hypothetical protein A8C56_11250 [Niabella ginsenosidivorans]|uniref:Uncharacterized protein n=1 Tax=Niabella ginsenosidivorans TaxID=1176587 RepID=A0A1A9I443_9BACT|nr:hypothetical protein [Niabella ginsenosidivorans]ANH81480.1 hypothetical protein A8C56_11250 [Niabella ginsenosidivorans]
MVFLFTKEYNIPVNSRNIIWMVAAAVMLIAFIYGLLYQLYVIKNGLFISLFALLIVADVVVFIKLFWNATANHHDDY